MKPRIAYARSGYSHEQRAAMAEGRCADSDGRRDADEPYQRDAREPPANYSQCR